jgi:hypothetical protein
MPSLSNFGEYWQGGQTGGGRPSAARDVACRSISPPGFLQDVGACATGSSHLGDRQQLAAGESWGR